jgi:short-chain fatty acids transporter
MVTRLHDTRLERFAQWTARLVPDAATMAVMLTFATASIALMVGNTFLQVGEAYHQGLWMLLPFSMQMTLIVVLSSALAITPFCRGAIVRLARLPKTRNQYIMAAFLATGACGYANWGLGYALGPMIAIYLAAEAERKEIAVDFPFLLATSYAGRSLWQYRVSSERAAAGGHQRAFSAKRDRHHSAVEDYLVARRAAARPPSR